MRTLSLVLLLALGLPGCSRFSQSGRNRAYYRKQIKQAEAAQKKRRKRLLEHQRAEMPSLRNSPPPLQQQTVQPAPEPENQ